MLSEVVVRKEGDEEEEKKIVAVVVSTRSRFPKKVTLKSPLVIVSPLVVVSALLTFSLRSPYLALMFLCLRTIVAMLSNGFRTT